MKKTFSKKLNIKCLGFDTETSVSHLLLLCKIVGSNFYLSKAQT